MQGSPLLRALFLLLVLLGTGWWIARVTHARPSDSPAPPPAVVERGPDSTRLPYRLTLSAPAAEVAVGTLDAGETPPVTTLQGELPSTAAAPVVTLVVRWRESAPEGIRRFAKLTFEIPGRETLEHVFESDGDIDDVWELPTAPQP